MSEDVNMKNTKKELLEVINKMKKELKQKQNVELNPEKKKEEVKKVETVKEADKCVETELSTQIHKLKLEINKELSEISEKLEDESKRYENLKDAITVKQLELQEIYGIESEAANLAVILETQKRTKEEFELNISTKRTTLEEEIAETKKAWEEDKQKYVTALKEGKDAVEKERKREKEEYEYKVNRARKIDANKYADENAKLEKEIQIKKEIFANNVAQKETELKNREEGVVEREKNIDELQKKVEQFPTELEKAVVYAVKTEKERLVNSFAQEKALLEKGFEGRKNVYEARISALELQVKEQARQIEKLGMQQENAYEKVQDIANKAVSSAAERKNNITVTPAKQERD